MNQSHEDDDDEDDDAIVIKNYQLVFINYKKQLL